MFFFVAESLFFVFFWYWEYNMADILIFSINQIAGILYISDKYNLSTILVALI